MASLEDIAQHVGVSKSTVSLVLNGKARKARISERRIKEITKAAEELNFVPNAAARAIRKGKFGQLGLLLSSIPTRALLLPGLLESIRITLREKDQLLLLGELPDNQLTNDDVLPRILREWAADGLLINYLEAVPERMRTLLDEHRIPTVWLNIKRDTDAVYCDDLAAATEATDHLIKLGHTHIAYLAMGINGHYSKADRQAGYTQAMRAAGLTPDIHQWDHSVDAPDRAEAAHEWLAAQSPRPTAVLTYGQGDALPLLTAALQLGLKVPQDLSIATFHPGPLTLPGLAITTWCMPSTELGRAGVELLLERIEKKATDMPSVVIPYTRVEGSTVAPPASA